MSTAITTCSVEVSMQLHNESLVWDSHGCMPQNIERLPVAMEQLGRYRAGGVDVCHLNIGDAFRPLDSLVRMAAFMRDWIKSKPEDYRLINSVEDIRLAKDNGQLAVAFDIEGAHALEHQISLVDLFYDLGVRWTLLSYNKSNSLAGGCHDIDRGLSDLGRRFVTKMEQVGMIVCCSHTGYRTAMDIFEHASNPVILSHSNPRSVYDHPRNVPDDVMKACAVTGGVQCINGLQILLGSDNSDPEALFRHIDYACETIGSEHVGLGLDFVFDTERDQLFGSDIDADANGDYWPSEYYAGVELTEESMFAPDRLPSLTACMLSHGYSPNDVQGILGGNMMRVASQVWR